MKKNISIWLSIYWVVLFQARNCGLILAFIGYLLCTVAVSVGFIEAQKIAQKTEGELGNYILSLQIAGVKWLFFLVVVFNFRIFGIWLNKKFSHFTSLLCLVLSMAIFLHFSKISSLGLIKVNEYLEQKGELTGYPIFFVYGTSSKYYVLLFLFLCVCVCFEVSLLVISFLKTSEKLKFYNKKH